MFRFVLLAALVCSCISLAEVAAANEYRGHGYQKSHCRAGLFGWRSYSAEERRNFPTCYGGYERYYGGFHANYFRDYPGNFDGLNNDRYGWGNGWAW